MKAIIITLFTSVVSAYSEKFNESRFKDLGIDLAITKTGYFWHAKESLSGFVQLDTNIEGGGYQEKFAYDPLLQINNSFTIE